jgi:hypothetical protein
MKSPIAQVKEKYGDKAKLVASIEKLAGDGLWLERTNKDKGLGHVANAKLLRLHDTFSAVKEKFGSRDKLVEAILEAEKRSKDEGYKARLAKYPVPRLWDMFRTLEKRAGLRAASIERAASTAEKPKKAAAPKAAPKAKKAAPKKTSAGT